jgi:hypothetical protein
MKQIVVIEFLTAEEVIFIEIYRPLNSVYRKHTVDLSAVTR